MININNKFIHSYFSILHPVFPLPFYCEGRTEKKMKDYPKLGNKCRSTIFTHYRNKCKCNILAFWINC